jgi:hypothetical protein
MAEGISRRQFLSTLARLAALGGIGALTAKLLAGRGGASRSGETCVNQGVCRGCSAFAGCGLPSALSARERAPWAGGAG